MLLSTHPTTNISTSDWEQQQCIAEPELHSALKYVQVLAPTQRLDDAVQHNNYRHNDFK
jgi:hypothetical protein